MQASAPGKLILTGEYAVLEGAPGLVMAVNRRARVTLHPSPDTRWQLLSRQAQDRRAGFVLGSDGGIRWDDPRDGQTYSLVQAVLRHLPALALHQAPPFRLELDTHEFFEPGGHKLGLGSSAALTVALVGALEAWAGRQSADQPGRLARLLAMHSAFQGGRGSGIDLAASLHGGLLEYRRSSDGPLAMARALPEGLSLRAVFTGRGASTPGMLRGLETIIREQPGGWESVRQDLLSGARDAAHALSGGRADAFLSSVAAYGRCLRRLQAFAGIPVYTEEHDRLASLAEDHGVTYKPSGAGGGDLGLALGTDAAALADFCHAAGEQGFACPDITVDPRGMILAE